MLIAKDKNGQSYMTLKQAARKFHVDWLRMLFMVARELIEPAHVLIVQGKDIFISKSVDETEIIQASWDLEKLQVNSGFSYLDDYQPLNEAAKKLDVSPSSLYSYCKDPRYAKHFMRVANYIYVNSTELETAIEYGI